MKYFTYSATRLGNRKSNQDRCHVCEKNGSLLLLIADGMGGHEGGDLAAQTFIESMTETFYAQQFPINQPRAFLQNSVIEAHQKIKRIKTASGQNPKTTCVCCLVQNGLTLWLHCGDSRCYLIREQKIHTQTVDHTYVQDLVQHKVINKNDIKTHPMRNYINACLGGKKPTPHISIGQLHKLQADDIILLCTDGLWSAVSDSAITSAFTEKNLDASIEQLTQLAEKQSWPQSDNISALAFRLIHYEINNQSAQSINPGATTPTKVSNKVSNKVSTKVSTDSQKQESLAKAIEDINAAYSLYENEIKNK